MFTLPHAMQAKSSAPARKSAFEILMFVSGLVGLHTLTSWTFDKIFEWYEQATDAEAQLLWKIDEAESEIEQLRAKLEELRAARVQVEEAEASLAADNDNGKSRRMVSPTFQFRA